MGRSVDRIFVVLAPLAFVLASRFVGLLREIVIAAGFGLSSATDAFYQLSAVPTYLMTYVTGPFATAYIAWATGPGRSAERRELRVLSRWLWAAGIVIAAVFLVGSVFVALRTGGDGGTLAAAILMALASVAVVRIGLGAAVSNARGHFSRAQALLFVNNFLFVGCISIAALYGTSDVLVVLAGSFFISAVISAAYAQLLLRKNPLEQDAVTEAGDSTAHSSMRQGFLPNLLYASVETGGFLLTQATVLILASASGTGMASAASLTQRLCLTANGLFIGPLSSIAMVHAAKKDPAARRVFTFKVIASTLVGLSVVALALLAVRPWLPAIVGGIGRFGPDDAIMVGSLIPAYALWLVAQGASMMLSRLCFAMDRARLFTVFTTGGYFVANILRVITYSRFGFPAAIGVGALVELVAVAMILIALASRRRAVPAT